MLTHMAPLLTRMAGLLTRMARVLTRMARMLTRMTCWLAGSHIIHTRQFLYSIFIELCIWKIKETSKRQ